MSSISLAVSLAYSVDADDAFMFHALRAGAIDAGGLSFTHRRDHTAALNGLALAGEADVVAVSVGVYPAIADRYQLLPHGASVGRGYGPVVVAPRPLRRRRSGGAAGRHPGRDHDRLAGAAADRAGRGRRRDPDRAVQPDLRGPGRGRGRRRAPDSRGAPALPGARPPPGDRPRRRTGWRGRGCRSRSA